MAENLLLGARLHSLVDFDFTGLAKTVDVRNRLGEMLGMDPVEEVEQGDVGEEAWAGCMQAMIDEVGFDAWAEKARELLAQGVLEEPTLLVGPVIGKVTDTTARILVESSHETDVTCTLEGDGCDPVELSIGLPRGRPVVMQFEDLCPGMQYQVTMSGVQVLCESCSFRTMPEGGWQLADGASPKFAVSSCNSVYTSYEMAHDAPANLWQDMATRMKEGTQIDYFLHLGDNVYNDIEWCCVEKGKMELTGYHCKWGIAYEWLKDMDPSEWADKTEDIEELFRTVYRETWGYPPQRYVLANVPNLMIFDDHDLRDDWGDRAVDYDASSLDSFIAAIAFKLVNEYQTQLYRDIPSEEYPECSYHLHALGDIGVAFLDMRACKTFHRRHIDAASPMLGVQQWRTFEDALFEDDGLFANCKALLVMSPQPVAYVSPQPTTIAGNLVVDDLLGQWSAPQHQAEVPRLLHSLNAWREDKTDRAVLIVGGDVHEGGWTDIVVASGHASDKDTLCMRQLTTSAISNKMTKAHEALAVVLTRDVAGALDGWTICGGWRFLHYDWSNYRNYAFLDFEMQDDKAVIGGYLIASDGETVSELDRHDTKEPHNSGWGNRLYSAGSAIGLHSGNALAGAVGSAGKQTADMIASAGSHFRSFFG